MPPSAAKLLLRYATNLPPPFRHLKDQVYPPGWRLPRHAHHAFHACAVMAGAADLLLDRPRPIRAGDVVIITAGVWHGWTASDQGLALFDLMLAPDPEPAADSLAFQLQDLLAGEPALIHHDRFRGLPLIEAVRRELTARQPGARLMAGALAGQLLIGWVRAARRARRLARPAPHASVLEEARRFIQANYGRPLSLADISRAVHVSPHHFCEIFSAAEGIPPMHYLARVRLERARELLGHPELRVEDVARAVGFNDLPHFSRTFRKHTGCPPLAFRRRLLRRAR